MSIPDRSFESNTPEPEPTTATLSSPSPPPPQVSAANSSTRHHVVPGGGILLERSGYSDDDTASMVEMKSNQRKKRKRGPPQRVRLNSTPVQVPESLLLDTRARDSGARGVPDKVPENAETEEGSSPLTTEAEERSSLSSPIHKPQDEAVNEKQEAGVRFRGQPATNTTEKNGSASPTKEKESQDRYKDKREDDTPLKTPSIWRRVWLMIYNRVRYDRHVQWMLPKVTNYQSMKPVIRCAVAVSHSSSEPYFIR